MKRLINITIDLDGQDFLVLGKNAHGGVVTIAYRTRFEDAKNIAMDTAKLYLLSGYSVNLMGSPVT